MLFCVRTRSEQRLCQDFESAHFERRALWHVAAIFILLIFLL
jgi:hypothetical protein